MSDLYKTPFTQRKIARVTIELTTPLHLGSGLPGDVSDATVVTDANGFPAIPGTSLAGVLRASVRATSSQETASSIFGDLLHNKATNDSRESTQSSRVDVSWACIHDAKDSPVEGIRDPLADMDEVLSLASVPTLRDHVRITHKGVAKERGKFDELAVHAGHRFTFEMEMVAKSGEDLETNWGLVLDALHSEQLRLGGKSRRGFGAFKVVRVLQKSFDLTSIEDNLAYRQHPSSLSAEPEGNWEKYTPDQASESEAFATLHLKPRNLWMFGGGVDLAENGQGVDLAPVRDSQVVWNNDQGKVVRDVIYMPGSSIKGAVAHRVAYHYNLAVGNFAGEAEADTCTGAANSAVRMLFGEIKSDGGGSRGHVIINDIYLKREMPSQRLPHVKIDSFTGGAYPSALFDERPILGLPTGMDRIEIKVYVTDLNESSEASSESTEKAKAALKAALQDLASGNLQLGGGTNRGLGAFEGDVEFTSAA